LLLLGILVAMMQQYL